jgi:hypothetical protein
VTNPEDVRPQVVVLTLLVIVVLGGIADLILDAPGKALSAHVVLEVVLVVVSAGGATYLAWGWYRTRRSLGTLREDLAAAQARRDAWRAAARGALEGRAREVDRQFGDWGLTPAEREVALM